MTSPPKQILLFGGSGFLGQELGLKLSALGYKIIVPSRSPEKTRLRLSFPADVVDYSDTNHLKSKFEESAIVMNLCGDSLADGRWTAAKKKRILHSRLESTRLIASLFESCTNKPEVFIQASAVGFYGMDTNGVSNESSPCGKGFLAEVCQQWENESRKTEKYTRLVIARFGVILGTTGGALPTILDIYALGLGARLGPGNQHFSWVHVDDVVRFFLHSIDHKAVAGIHNLVAPTSTQNTDWHRILKKHYTCLSPLAVPSPVLKVLLGEKSQLILSGGRVQPQRTMESGFSFETDTLDKLVNKLVVQRPYPKLHFIHVKQWVPTPLNEVWEFFSTEKNLEKITPEFLNFHVTSMTTEEIGLNTEICYKLKLHGLPLKWRSLIQEWEPGKHFVDYQLAGPYKIWHHQHNFTELDGGTLIEDFVHYQLPLWPFGSVAFPFVRKDVGNIFNYRQDVLNSFLG